MIAKKEEGPSEKKENIIAAVIFIILLGVIIGLFTKGFGLFETGITDDGSRITVPLGNDPVMGAKNPKVMIIGFSDYECPFCSKAETTIQSILTKYPDDVAFVFKDMPLTKMHPSAYASALAAECAKEQGKYWEYHKYLFDHQNELGIDKLKSYAQTLELNSEQFNDCLDSMRYKNEVDKDIVTAKQVGVSATPAFFINGRKLVGAYPEETFVKIIEEELKNKNI